MHREITYTVASNGCFICTSHKPHYTGYPQIKVKYKKQSIHRYLYQLMYGILSNHVVHHRCENKMCINVEHLEAKELSVHDRDHHAKLSALQVLDIRQDKGHTQQDLALLFGIKQPEVSRILRGERWAIL
ncbi:hypothetical protein LCGC14_1367570 [marine sediment metagenome]|uniref:HNH nuclease domain-containing protein n=1 Tax=marine sediment metagenome TaxID=412755 RepID=A0A0F9N896_9ZZZZ